jgi:hypothetical protein
VLFEGVDNIEFNYRDVHFGGGCSLVDGGGSATIGVQVTSQLATQFSYNSPLLQDQTSLLWTWK